MMVMGRSGFHWAAAGSGAAKAAMSAAATAKVRRMGLLLDWRVRGKSLGRFPSPHVLTERLKDCNAAPQAAKLDRNRRRRRSA
jgi:hypothetical protein